MKHRFHIALPPSGSSARVPALLLPVLAAAAVLQLLLPHGEELPPGGAPLRSKQVAPPPEVPRVAIPPALAGRSVFSPGTAASADGTPAPTDVLGGAVIAGTVMHGRRLYAVVQERGGQIRHVALGGLIAGWRISALTPTGARMTRASEQFNAAYGAIPKGPAAPAPDDSEDGQ